MLFLDFGAAAPLVYRKPGIAARVPVILFTVEFAAGNCSAADKSNTDPLGIEGETWGILTVR